MRQSYRQLIKIHQALDNLMAERASEIDGQPIILFGPTDEIREILMQHLKDRLLAYEAYAEFDLLKKNHAVAGCLILTWREEEETALNDDCSAVNIMKLF